MMYVVTIRGLMGAITDRNKRNLNAGISRYKTLLDEFGPAYMDTLTEHAMALIAVEGESVLLSRYQGLVSLVPNTLSPDRLATMFLSYNAMLYVYNMIQTELLDAGWTSYVKSLMATKLFKDDTFLKQCIREGSCPDRIRDINRHIHVLGSKPNTDVGIIMLRARLFEMWMACARAASSYDTCMDGYLKLAREALDRMHLCSITDGMIAEVLCQKSILDIYKRIGK